MTSNASRTARLGAALGLVAAGLAPAAAAQPNDLPSLTPRVFESRGTIRVSLPDIERQPLSGFGPPPRVFVVSDDRVPAQRPFDPNVDALPAFELEPPPEPPTDLAEARTFRAEAGAGAQFARYGRLDLSQTAAAGVFFVDADYDGLSGQESEGRVDFDRVGVRAGGQSFAPGRVSLEAHALVDRYSTPATILSARRERRAVGAEAATEGVGEIPFRAALRYQQSRLSRLDDTEAETNEGRLDAEGRVGFFEDRLRLDAAGGTAGAGGGLTGSRYGAAGVAFAMERAGGRLVLGVRGLAFDATSLAGGGSGQAIGPIVDVQLPFRDLGTLFITNDPHLEVRSLGDLTGLNPYVTPGPIVSPDVVPVDARAGLEIRRGPARLRGYALGLYAPTYLIFERLGDDYTETYVDARIYGLGGDLAVATASGVSASAGVEFRTAGVDTGGDEIPFYAPLAVHAGLAVPFDRDRGRFGLTLHAENERPVDRVDSDRAGSFALLSFDARYDVYGPFSAVLRGERLLGEVERWPGFPEAPYAVMLGVRFSGQSPPLR